jgi:hypothetical protein
LQQYYKQDTLNLNHGTRCGMERMAHTWGCLKVDFLRGLRK